MAAAVEIKEVGKRYGSRHILRDVSLSIKAGEFITLVGPSGCGKSTLLRVIAGLTPQDQGMLHIDGNDVSQTAPSDRNVAMVFQSYALYPHMTVAQNIATPLRMQRLGALSRLPFIGRWVPGSKAIRQAIHTDVMQVAAQVQLEQLLDSRPAQLSGGQRQRVAVARAMVRQPGVFLMDEPLSNLDARLRVHMRAEIAALHQRLGATFIYVTHDQVEAMTLSTRVAVMMDGEIVQVGTPGELYSSPIDIRVARFIGSPEINLLPAACDVDGIVSLGNQRLSLRMPDGTEGPLSIGWRPECLTLADTAAVHHRNKLRLQTRLERIEVLGHDALLFCRHAASGSLLTARLLVAEIDKYRSAGKLADHSVVLQADVANALLFDSQGQRIEPYEAVTMGMPLRMAV